MSWHWLKSVDKRLYAGLIKLLHILEQKPNANVDEYIKNMYSSSQWEKISYTSAVNLFNSSLRNNSAGWRAAARNSGNAKVLNTYLRRDVEFNVAFKKVFLDQYKIIKSLPLDVAKEITAFTSKQVLAGVRAEVIEHELKKKIPQIIKYKARLIARTETAKAQAAITHIRSDELGIQWYRWKTANDRRVRTPHKLMEDVYCSYKQPPNPEVLDGKKNQFGNYNPGTVPNCRCYAEPVIDIDFMNFPVKVYYNGKIQKMTKKQFLQIQ